MKTALIGAGSVAFSRRLIGDLLCMDGVTPDCLALMDIHPGRLELAGQFAQRAIEASGRQVELLVTEDTRAAVEGADYVIISIRGGCWEPRPLDIGIPLRYGVNQRVGDTIGPGGIFQGLRNVPDLAVIAGHLREVAPRALVLNHSNPMAINCWTWSVAWPDIRHVGLCHSVQGTAEQLAAYLDIPAPDLDYWVAGINHMAWFLRLERKGEDLYPLLRERMEDPEIYAKDRVRFEILRHFGYFVTESSGHMSEYCPYFRRTPQMLERYGLDSMDLEAMARRYDEHMARLRKEIESPDPIQLKRTHEYTVKIIEAIETDRPCQVNVSVPNTGLITNLPQGCAVEVPCMVDRRGVHPCYVGELPPQLAGLNESNIRSQALAVKAGLEGDREALYMALALDPLTSSVLPLDAIRQMADEMLAAQRQWLPQFA